jgi:hypothetical protein
MGDRARVDPGSTERWHAFLPDRALFHHDFCSQSSDNIRPTPDPLTSQRCQSSDKEFGLLLGLGRPCDLIDNLLSS